MSVFNRQIGIRFQGPSGTIDLTNTAQRLNIGFTVTRTLDLEPNTLSATIHNLSKDTQQRLRETVEGWTVELTAGYGTPESNNAATIFKGDVRLVRHRREPPLLATDVEADDGGEASKVYRTRHFGKGTTVGTVFKWLQEQSGLGAGNVERITQIRRDDGLPDRIKSGISIKGYVMDEMGDIARGRGAVVTSYNNEVLVLQYGEPLPNTPLTTIGPRTGLIGYPYVDNEGILVLNHRMLPNVFPGSPIEVESEFVNSRFVVERAVYSGSLWDDDFNIEVEGRELAA